MMTDDFRILGCDQPVNARMRITGAQFYQHRDRMHNIAERGRFDQQNAREFGAFEPRAVRVVYVRSFELPIQFAKLSHQGPLGRAPHSVRAERIPWGGHRTARPTNVYAAFFWPDNAPRIFFIQAENRWRFCSRRTTASLVTQLN